MQNVPIGWLCARLSRGGSITCSPIDDPWRACTRNQLELDVERFPLNVFPLLNDRTASGARRAALKMWGTICATDMHAWKEDRAALHLAHAYHALDVLNAAEVAIVI